MAVNVGCRLRKYGLYKDIERIGRAFDYGHAIDGFKILNDIRNVLYCVIEINICHGLGYHPLEIIASSGEICTFDKVKDGLQ